jgi:ubiquinone/menaquinone biosynthesis C-methylase UbiE
VKKYHNSIYDSFFGSNIIFSKLNIRNATDRDEQIMDAVEENALINPGMKGLDLGCGTGRFAASFRQRFKVIVLGVDSSIKAKSLSQKNLIEVKVSDLNEALPFDKNSQDFIISIEVLEHLVNPDGFLNEIKRILKPGGYLILTTPNLASWYNRVLLVLGIQPILTEVSTKSKAFGMGFLKQYISNPPPAGHLRIATKNALYDMINYYGFRNIKIFGMQIHGTFGIFQPLDAFFSHIPSIASDLIIICQK